MRPIVNLKAIAAPPATGTVPLAALRLCRTLAWPVGQAEADFSPAATPPGAGEKVVIEGASDGTSIKPLFTGRVLRCQKGTWGTRLLVEEPTGSLARLYVDKKISSGNAAKAIMELCNDAGLESASVEQPGALLPSLALLSNRSGLDHVLKLARISGFLVRTDADGRLHASTPLPAPGSVVLRPVDPVLDFRAEDDPDEPPGGSISGDGAMGANGSGAEDWVLKSLSGITGGSGKPVEHIPALKTLADVNKAAEAERVRLQEARYRRTVILAGIPPSDLGEVILLQGFGDGDGPARVVGLEVLWGADSGLITRMRLHGTGG